ncbi:MAG: LysR substrate-binding domain-containing protein [Gammaproteobacteria bacterium]
MRDELNGVPSFDGLKTFLAVCRRMSITGAGEALHLTQSAVSRQIQSLERSLGVQLFRRQHRGIKLTSAGQSLRDLVGPWSDELARFCATHGTARLAPVTVTASVGVTALWLLPRLAAFNNAHPDIDLRIAAHNRVVDLESEDVDLAVRYSQGAPAGDAILMFGDTILPVAAPELKSAFKSSSGILEHPLIEFDDRARPWLTWNEWLSILELPTTPPPRLLRFNHYDQVIQAALEGQGIALGRLPLVRPLIQQGRLVAPAWKPRKSDFGYWLLTRKRLRPEAETVMEWLMQEANAEQNYE